ncbi:hypothetical protein GCM10009715_38350 [Paeniglutamicibacter psychrophenolicus]
MEKKLSTGNRVLTQGMQPTWISLALVPHGRRDHGRGNGVEFLLQGRMDFVNAKRPEPDFAVSTTTADGCELRRQELGLFGHDNQENASVVGHLGENRPGRSIQ